MKKKVIEKEVIEKEEKKVNKKVNKIDSKIGKEEKKFTNSKNKTNAKTSTKKSTKNSDKKKTTLKNVEKIDTKDSNENTIYSSSKQFLLNLKQKFDKLFEKEEKKEYISEYYELPQTYNESTVRLIAQTPKRLFVYWDISTRQKESLIASYGKTFFEDSYPILIVKNKSGDVSFEVEVNDFANSWYIDIPDNSTSYKVEYGRRLKKDTFNQKTKNQKVSAPKNIYSTNILWDKVIEKKNLNETILFPAFMHSGDVLILKTSNELISPNGHIKESETVSFMDIKTKDIETIEFKEIKKASNLIYKELNKITKENSNEYIGS